MFERGILSRTAELFRAKAQAVLAMAAAATDGIIAAELRILAGRYLSRAREIETEGARTVPGARPRRSGRRRSLDRRTAPIPAISDTL